MAETDFFEVFFRSVYELYEAKLHCDVKIFSRESRANLHLKPVECHSLVLCSIAPVFKKLLNRKEVENENGERWIFLPDMDYHVVKKFIDDIYNGMNNSEFSLNLTSDLAKVCGMFADDDSDDKENTDATQTKSDDDLDEGIPELNKGMSLTASRATLKRRVAQKRPGWSLGEFFFSFRPALKKASHVRPTPAPPSVPKPKVESRIIQGPHRYNPQLSIVKHCFKKIESVKNGFRIRNGAFRATTDCFYCTPKIVSDKENVITIYGVQRQFRMKLPEKEFVAIVAVGMRNGENIVVPLASMGTYWQHQNSFANLVEMSKNICGVSFGEILRHPRCSEGYKDKLSRDCINRFKDNFRKLSEEERSKIGVEQQKYLKEIDAPAQKLDLHPLPLKPVKLEFNLVSEITREDIMDYAIVSGNEVKELIIQSLFNFHYQKIPQNRLVTILCDLISCFCGIGNSSPLYEFQILKEAFDRYASRTCQILALQELGINTENVSLEEVDSTLNKTAGIPAKGKRFAKGLTMSPADIKAEMKRRFPCNIDGCKRFFFKESQRDAHVKKDHCEGSDANNKVCPPCGKVMRNAKDLSSHIYQHHTPKECKECNLQFPGAYQFYLHRSHAHVEMTTCEICGKSCRGKEKLRVHKINKHLPDSEKPFVCSVCGKGYAHKTKLQSHQMNVHIRSRPFKCRLEGCEADFNELANRNAHERNVHKFDYRKTMKDLEDSVNTTA